MKAPKAAIKPNPDSLSGVREAATPKRRKQELIIASWSSLLRLSIPKSPPNLSRAQFKAMLDMKPAMTRGEYSLNPPT